MERHSLKLQLYLLSSAEVLGQEDCIWDNHCAKSSMGAIDGKFAAESALPCANCKTEPFCIAVLAKVVDASLLLSWRSLTERLADQSYLCSELHGISFFFMSDSLLYLSFLVSLHQNSIFWPMKKVLHGLVLQHECPDTLWPACIHSHEQTRCLRLSKIF